MEIEINNFCHFGLFLRFILYFLFKFCSDEMEINNFCHFGLFLHFLFTFLFKFRQDGKYLLLLQITFSS